MSEAEYELRRVADELQQVNHELRQINRTLEALILALSGVSPPSTLQSVHLTIQGEQKMPAAVITVDTVGATVSLGGADDHGNPISLPAGTVVTFASDTDTVLTVGASSPGADAAGNVTAVASLTPVALGTANLSATVADASGNPLLEADGVTPIPAPAPVAQPVVAGPLGEFVLGDTA